MKHSLWPAVVLAASLSAPGAFALSPGATVFNAHCAMCHGPEGEAPTPLGKKLHAPALTSPWISKQSDATLIHVIENGREHMPAFKNRLDSAQITAVVGYIREIEKK